jgi:hypothetical protein
VHADRPRSRALVQLMNPAPSNVEAAEGRRMVLCATGERVQLPWTQKSVDCLVFVGHILTVVMERVVTCMHVFETQRLVGEYSPEKAPKHEVIERVH